MALELDFYKVEFGASDFKLYQIGIICKVDTGPGSVLNSLFMAVCVDPSLLPR